jgi:hypothetical protein
MLAAGIVAGYLLYRETRDLWRWAILVLLFIFFEEWIRGALIAGSPAAMASGYHDGTIPATLAAVTFGVFGLAVSAGAMIKAVYGKGLSYEEKLKKAEEVANSTSIRPTEV